MGGKATEPKLIARDAPVPQDSYVLNPMGIPVKVDPQQAYDYGPTATALSKEQAQMLAAGHENRMAAEELGTLGQFGAGVGSGLTLGLGPAVLARMGLIDPGLVAGLETTGAYTAGDVAGMVLPAIASGGEGVLARGMRLTPAGMMGAFGGAAESAAARLLPEMGVMGKLAAPALQMGARGAAEGAIVAGSHAAAQNIIQDQPLAWSSIAAQSLDGALMGGLLGAGFGGVTGALGAGVEALGSAAGRVGTAESRPAAIALKRMGHGEGTLKDALMNDTKLLDMVKAEHDLVAKGGASFASDTPTLMNVTRGAVKDSAAAIDDVLSTAQKEAARFAPDGQRVAERIKTETAQRFAGTMLQEDAMKVASKLSAKIAPEAPEAFVPKAVKSLTDTETMAANEAGHKAYQKAVAEHAESGVTTWEGWHKTRMQLDEMAKTASIKYKPIYEAARDIIDSEISAQLTSAGAAIGKDTLQASYVSAVANKALAEGMAERIAGKYAEKLGSTIPRITPADLGAFTYGSLAGHPIGVTAIIAAKKALGVVGNKIEPYMAEAAYRSAIGAKAEGARVMTQNRMSNGVRKFLKLSPRLATYGAEEQRKTPPPKYDVKSYQKTLEATEQLTSVQHAEQVKQVVAALMQLGQAGMAQAAQKQYDAAAAYLMYNMPMNSKLKEAGSVTKMPVKGFLDGKEMKFMRIDRAIKNPLSLIDDLESGNLSTDSVKAVKYVYPEFHKMLADTARQEVFEMKQDGKFLPADKVALLGTALDEPIDTTLEKSFVDTIQAAHAANHQPPPDPGPQPVPTDTTDFQTPLQRAMG